MGIGFCLCCFRKLAINWIDQKLVIVIDTLDAIALTSQAPSTNLFYLSRYLCDRTYFILARRPFLREKSGLLIEAPSQTPRFKGLSRTKSGRCAELHSAIPVNRTRIVPTTRNSQRKQFHVSESDVTRHCPGIHSLMLIWEKRPHFSLSFHPGLAAYYHNHYQQMRGDSFSAS